MVKDLYFLPISSQSFWRELVVGRDGSVLGVGAPGSADLDGAVTSVAEP